MAASSNSNPCPNPYPYPNPCPKNGPPKMIQRNWLFSHITNKSAFWSLHNRYPFNPNPLTNSFEWQKRHSRRGNTDNLPSYPPIPTSPFNSKLSTITCQKRPYRGNTNDLIFYPLIPTLPFDSEPSTITLAVSACLITMSTWSNAYM